MSPTLELSGEKDIEGRNRGIERGQALAETDHLSIVVGAHQFSSGVVVGDSGANAGNLVRRHADSDATAADEHSAIDGAGCDQTPHRRTKVRIVDPILAMRAHVGHFMAQPAQVSGEGVFEMHASVI